MANGGFDIDQFSDPLVGYTYVTYSMAVFTLNVIEKPDQGNINIAEHPTATNNFTLIISVDDEVPVSENWYEFEIIPPKEVTTPITNSTSDTNTKITIPEEYMTSGFECVNVMIAFLTLIVIFSFMYQVKQRK
jgi:hypothetical protein